MVSWTFENFTLEVRIATIAHIFKGEQLVSFLQKLEKTRKKEQTQSGSLEMQLILII